MNSTISSSNDESFHPCNGRCNELFIPSKKGFLILVHRPIALSLMSTQMQCTSVALPCGYPVKGCQCDAKGEIQLRHVHHLSLDKKHLLSKHIEPKNPSEHTEYCLHNIGRLLEQENEPLPEPEPEPIIFKKEVCKTASECIDESLFEHDHPAASKMHFTPKRRCHKDKHYKKRVENSIKQRDRKLQSADKEKYASEIGVPKIGNGGHRAYTFICEEHHRNFEYFFNWEEAELCGQIFCKECGMKCTFFADYDAENGWVDHNYFSDYYSDYSDYYSDYYDHVNNYPVYDYDYYYGW